MTRRANHDQDDPLSEDAAVSGETDGEVTRTPYTFARGTDRPLQLAVAALVVGLQGLVLSVWAAYAIYESLVGNPTDQTAAIMGGVFGLGAGLAIVWFGVSFWRKEVWPRAPVIVLELIVIPIAWTLAFRADQPASGVPLLISAVLIIAMLMSKPVRESFNREA